MISVSYSEARRHFASIWDSITRNREAALIHRRGAEDIAILPAEELRGLMEVSHLLASDANAKRLNLALQDALSAKSHSQTIDELKAELGI